MQHSLPDAHTDRQLISLTRNVNTTALPRIKYTLFHISPHPRRPINYQLAATVNDENAISKLSRGDVCINMRQIIGFCHGSLNDAIIRHVFRIGSWNVADFCNLSESRGGNRVNKVLGLIVSAEVREKDSAIDG